MCIGAAYNKHTAAYNIAVGRMLLIMLNTGTRNLAIGAAHMTASDTENDNIAIGYDAMTTNTAGGQYNLRLVTMLQMH